MERNIFERRYGNLEGSIEKLKYDLANPSSVFGATAKSQEYLAAVTTMTELVAKLQENIKSWQITNQGNVNDNIKLKDKLHRRNLQIADLKKLLQEIKQANKDITNWILNWACSPCIVRFSEAFKNITR